MERNIAIMIASVPAMRPLAEPFLRITSRFFTITQKLTSDGQVFEMQSRSKDRQDVEHDTYLSQPRIKIWNRSRPHGLQGKNTIQEYVSPIQVHEHI